MLFYLSINLWSRAQIFDPSSLGKSVTHRCWNQTERILINLRIRLCHICKKPDRANFRIHVRAQFQHITFGSFSILKYEHGPLELLLHQRLKTSCKNVSPSLFSIIHTYVYPNLRISIRSNISNIVRLTSLINPPQITSPKYDYKPNMLQRSLHGTKISSYIWILQYIHEEPVSRSILYIFT